MKITISENEKDAGITAYLDGSSIGWADYNYEGELALGVVLLSRQVSGLDPLVSIC
ncbi:MAG: hypothetical protein RPR91_11965 [Colwellia sp.]|jgi:hypothetical protein